MAKFVIERTLPGAGSLTANELQAISRKSDEVLAGMAPRAPCQHRYVTSDKIYCVYLAEEADAVYEQARLGGFPTDSVSQVSDPTTGD